MSKPTTRRAEAEASMVNLSTIRTWAMMRRGRSVVLDIDNSLEVDATASICLNNKDGEEVISGLAKNLPRLLERAADWAARNVRDVRGENDGENVKGDER